MVHSQPAQFAPPVEPEVSVAKMGRVPINLIWRDLEGLSIQETAEVLGLSEGMVKVCLHRVRLKLRELLSGYFASQRVKEI